MDALLLHAQRILAEAELLATGNLVRLTHCPEDGAPFVQLVPYRVARYARRVLGADSAFPSGTKILFEARGLTVAVEPSEEAYFDFIRVMLAHCCASAKRSRRELRIERALARKGGAAL